MRAFLIAVALVGVLVVSLITEQVAVKMIQTVQHNQAEAIERALSGK